MKKIINALDVTSVVLVFLCTGKYTLSDCVL
jgi:hypothetical protein